ncbi:MAG: nucleoside kinase [Pseudomonadota bacterium]
METQQLIQVQLGPKKLAVLFGTLVGEVLRHHWPAGEHPPLAAIFHNRCVDLDYPVTAPGEIRPVDYTMREGVLVYRRTATLMLLEAVRRLFGQIRVSVSQAHGPSYAYRIKFENEFSKKQMKLLEQQLSNMVAEDFPLTKKWVTLAEARDLFASRGAKEKLRLLKTWWEDHVPLVFCGGICDIRHYPVAPSTGCLKTFQLVYQPSGLILRFPSRGNPQSLAPYVESPKLELVSQESALWLNQLGVANVGQLNELTLAGEGSELIRIAEGLHEKKIVEIADRISHPDKEIRLVLIAGPSSSGKTTFSKRLSLQLRVNGIRPIAVSTDNFYVNRENTPLDESGEYDFESIEAIDLELFNKVLAALLRGETVCPPRFNFTTGKRKPDDKCPPMQLEKGQVILIEGIHALNPRLTAAITEHQKFKVYVSALTQLCLDDHNRIFTSDTRLIRRIVRDRMFRGYSALQTIKTWPRVRRGEMRNIYPFQEEADMMFDSALVYEYSVLRLYAERFLLEIPQNDPAFATAYRLLKFSRYFVPIFDESIPQTSLLREFIGGSYFDY